MSVGLRRSKAGFSKVVCGTNGGVGIVADEPHAAEILLRAMWNRWRPSEMEVFGSKIIPATRLTWAPSFTIHVDLRGPSEAVAGKFKKQTRYALRKALGNGVKGVIGSKSEIPGALDLITMTAVKKHFRLPPRDYLAALHQSFARSGMSQFILAKQDGRTIAAVHVLGARGIASWWKGGATEEGYSLNAPTVAMATAIQVAAKHGFDTFDMGGTHPTDPKYRGIHLYKSSFGGRLVETFLGHRSTIIARTARRLTPVNPW